MVTMSEQIEVQSPLFAIIPEWVLVDASDRAIHLYARLNRYANKGGECWPSRSTLAEHLGCSVESIDRAVKELVKIGALEVTNRNDPDNPKRKLTSIYRLRMDQGGTRVGAGTPTRVGAGTPTRVGDERVPAPVTKEPESLNESQENQSLVVDASVANDITIQRLCHQLATAIARFGDREVLPAVTREVAKGHEAPDRPGPVGTGQAHPDAP